MMTPYPSQANRAPRSLIWELSPHHSCKSTTPGYVPFSCGQNSMHSTCTVWIGRVLIYGSTAASVIVGRATPLGNRDAPVPICSNVNGAVVDSMWYLNPQKWRTGLYHDLRPVSFVL